MTISCGAAGTSGALTSITGGPLARRLPARCAHQLALVPAEIGHKWVREYQLCGVHANKSFSAAIWSCAGRLKRVIKHILPPAAGSAEPGIGDAISFIAAPKARKKNGHIYVSNTNKEIDSN